MLGILYMTLQAAAIKAAALDTVAETAALETIASEVAEQIS